MSDEQTRSRIVSLIVPCFNEEAGLHFLVEEIAAVLKDRSDWELVLVDDGSRDGTWAEIMRLSRDDRRVRGVRLSRNFGHQSALVAGMSAARGDAVVTLDADRQHPPEMIPKLLAKWREGFQVVETVREDEPTLPLGKRISSRLFYRVFSFLSGIDVRPGQADFRLMDRRVVDAILAMNERRPFLRGLVNWLGFRQTSLPYQARSREVGATKYTLRKMIRLAVDGSLAFSYVPIRISTAVGLLMTLAAILYGGYAVFVRVVLGLSAAVPGWASIIALMSLFFGVLYLQIGLMGEYLARIYVEGKTRPIFVVSEQTED